MPAPHRVVDGIVDGAVDAVDGLGRSLTGALRSGGETIMNALDKPFAAITGKEGPHRIIDRLADGALDTVDNAASAGLIGSAKKAGEMVMSALDHPVEQVGFPPKLEGTEMFGLGKWLKK